MQKEKLSLEQIPVLILNALPLDADRLRLDEAARELKTQMKLVEDPAKKLVINQAWAVRTTEIYTDLLNIKPRILQFSCHGSMGNLYFENSQGFAKSVSERTLVDLIKSIKPIECVLLIACNTLSIAEALAEHVDYVVGTNSEIDDDGAIAFTRSFYRSIAHGYDYETAFGQALVEIDLDHEDGERENYVMVSHGKVRSEKPNVNGSKNQDNDTEISSLPSSAVKNQINGGVSASQEDYKIQFGKSELPFARVSQGQYLCPNTGKERTVFEPFYIMKKALSLVEIFGFPDCGEYTYSDIARHNSLFEGRFKLPSESEWELAMVGVFDTLNSNHALSNSHNRLGLEIPPSGYYEPTRSKFQTPRRDDLDVQERQNLVSKYLKKNDFGRKQLRYGDLVGDTPIRFIYRGDLEK
ncbi:MAG: hypothetical protein ABJO86_19195 [Lentilitoribacter sp.]